MSLIAQKDEHTVAQLDTMSQALLPVIRYFYLALRVPASHGWRHGFDCAIGKWGLERGLVIANAAQKFIYDLLRFRQNALHFYDPLDTDMREKISPDEKTVLSLLIFMRNDETRKARDIISMLHKGRNDPVFVRRVAYSEIGIGV